MHGARRAWWVLMVGLVAAACAPTAEPGDEPCPEPGTVQLLAPIASLRTDASALADGFQVPRTALRLEDDGVLTLEASPDAVYVTCAAFRCPPRFARIEPERRDRALFEPRWELTNFDACVVAYDHLVSERPQLLPQQLQQVPPAVPCEGSTVAPEALEAARASALWLGCWVYGPTGIIEASELRPVPASPDAPALVESCAALDQDPSLLPPGGWAGCLRPSDQGVGVCVAGSCVAWCSHERCPASG